MTSNLPIPPVDLRFMGKTDEQFYADGDHVLNQVWALAHGQSDDAVLEIGSGYGRIAHALLRRDDFVGTYVGMDILPRHVAWCTEHLTPASNDRFRFHHLDVHNGRYNARGKLATSDVTFQFAGESTLVFLTSVFTHMYPDGVEHYISEMAKVMAPGARAAVTFFLQNDSQREHEAAGLSNLPLDFDLPGPVRYHSAKDPLHVIAYEEPWVHKTVQDAGLSISEIQLGGWCGRKGATLGQDMLLITKP